MRKLLKYLNRYKIESILSPLLKMLEATFELIVPLVVASMIDVGIKDDALGGKGYITRCFLILVALGFVGLLVSCTAQFFAAKAATGFAKALRHDLFSHLLKLSFSQIDNIGTSTMITRMTADVNTLQNGVNMFLRLFLRSPFIVIGAMVMAFTIDVKCALIFLAVIILLSLVVFLIMRSNIPMLKKVQKKLDEVLNLTRENLSGARVIRAFTQEEKQYDEFVKANNELSDTQLRAGKVSGLLNPLTYVLINLAIVALILMGSKQVSDGVLSTGQVVALYNYMSQILVELIKFASLIVTVNKSLACANRVNEVFDIEAGMPNGQISQGDTKSDYYLEFRNVSLKYLEGGDEAVTNISFAINKGQTLGIIGGTGSGKTSVANLIPRFYDATEGEVLIDGVDVRTADLKKLRAGIGYVMQKAVLFEGTIKDNLLWGNEDATEEEIFEALKIAVAEDIVKQKGGLDAMVEAGGKNFSGGQRQRLTIARALVRKPEILILDDSSSALDYVTDLQLRKNIASLESNPTVIIISQRTASVQDADKIVVLDDGKMAGYGTHEELLDNSEVYKEIFDSSFRKEGE